MKTVVDLTVRLAAVGAVLWAASGIVLYALFIALCFSETSYAFYPALVAACYFIQARFIFRSITASPVASWLASVVTCGVAAVGGAYGFIDITEGEPGLWDWMNGQSLLGAALLASLVVFQTCRRAPNKPASPNAGIASRLTVKHQWPGVGEPERWPALEDTKL